MAKAVTANEMWGASAHDGLSTIWKCDCGAWVACHRGSDIPLGFPAHRELRDLRQRAAHAFTRIWEAKMRLQGMAKTRARHAGVEWLCTQLVMEPQDCWPGHWTKDICRRVIALCDPLAERMQAVEFEAARRRKIADGPAEAF